MPGAHRVQLARGVISSVAKGRMQTGRRKATRTCYNHLPRLHSPEGVEARHERRIDNMPKARHDGEFTKPGSRNPRKIGRK